MISKVKAACLHSLTIAWSYALAAVGGLMSVIDSVGAALGDPGLKGEVSAAIGDARTAGRILLGISVITILARLRSLKREG